MKSQIHKIICRVFFAVGLAAGAIALSQCNTVKGVGYDMQQTGRFLSQPFQ